MITWDAIAKATEGMKTVPIKNKDYVQVPERIKAFRQICPNGCISTEIVSLTEDMVVMKTTIADEDGKVLGTGLAFEMKNSSFINKTSYIENCETSAVGRALGMLAIGVDASMASADELVNAILNQNKDDKPTDPKETANLNAEQQGVRNTRRLKELSAKTGVSNANFKDWKAMAVDNHIIPERKWSEYTDDEITNFARFVEMNVNVSQTA